MNQKRKIIGALCLLMLFAMYQTSLLAFAHVHYVNGVLVTHSHPFHGSHTHSQTSLLVIGQLSTFGSFDIEPYEEEQPMRVLVAVFDVEAAMPTVKGKVERALSLRAPPFSIL